MSKKETKFMENNNYSYEDYIRTRELENRRLAEAAMDFMKRHPSETDTTDYYEKNHISAAIEFCDKYCLPTLKENDRRNKMVSNNSFIDNQNLRSAAEIFCAKFCKH